MSSKLVFPPQPPKVLASQVWATTPGPKLAFLWRVFQVLGEGKEEKPFWGKENIWCQSHQPVSQSLLLPSTCFSMATDPSDRFASVWDSVFTWKFPFKNNKNRFFFPRTFSGLSFWKTRLFLYLNEVAITECLDVALNASTFHSFNWDCDHSALTYTLGKNLYSSSLSEDWKIDFTSGLLPV